MAKLLKIFATVVALFLGVGAVPLKEKDVTIGDMIVSPELYDALKSGRNAIESRKWPTNIIPVLIDPQYTPAQRDHINQAFDMIKIDSCISFVEYDPTVHAHWIHIRPQPSNGICSAQLGFVGGYQWINAPVIPGNDCFDYPGDIAHEILHALGFAHMHQTASRDDYIRILWQNIPDRYVNNFNIYEFSTLFSTDYDFESIMHYAPNAGSNPGTNAFEPKKPVDPDIIIGQSTHLTSGDYARLNRLYCTD